MSDATTNKKKKQQRVVILDRVIGTTTLHNNALSTNESNGEIAYLAGAAIVTYVLNSNVLRSRFQDSVKDVRESVQRALHLLRELSRTSTFLGVCKINDIISRFQIATLKNTGTVSEFKSASEMFETSIRDAHHEIGTLRMSSNMVSASPSLQNSSMSSFNSMSSPVNVEAILDKYSDRLMEKLERKMSKKKEEGN